MEHTINEMKADVAELQKFITQAERTNVKDVLKQQVTKMQTEVVRLEDHFTKIKLQAESKASNDVNAEQSPVAQPQRKYDKELKNYAWDQSDKFMKLYVEIDGVHNVPETNVVSEFYDRGVKLAATVNNVTYKVHVAPLFSEIDPSASKIKVKTNKVLIMLKKVKEGETWAFVIEKEKKKTPGAGDKNKDPQAGMMDMLKQMYEDGDDEMKKTIAKSMSEKGKGGAPGMPGMGGGMPGMGGGMGGMGGMEGMF